VIRLLAKRVVQLVAHGGDLVAEFAAVRLLRKAQQHGEGRAHLIFGADAVDGNCQAGVGSKEAGFPLPADRGVGGHVAIVCQVVCQVKRFRLGCRKFSQVTRWGGWGSNPRPKDYESSGGTLILSVKPTFPQVRTLVLYG
jgi:hypothetical protein